MFYFIAICMSLYNSRDKIIYLFFYSINFKYFFLDLETYSNLMGQYFVGGRSFFHSSFYPDEVLIFKRKSTIEIMKLLLSDNVLSANFGLYLL